MWKYYNPNPAKRNVGDCAVRAVSAALDMDWQTAYCELVSEAYYQCDMPSSNAVINSVLKANGFVRRAIPDYCPDCYTAEDFCRDFPYGTYVLGFGNHIATEKDGILLDSWDSSQEVPQYFYKRKGQ